MEAYNSQVPLTTHVPDMRFESNAQFHNRNLVRSGDSAFVGSQRKSWVRSRAAGRFNREALSTLLSTHSDNSEECIEKLLSENISYRDLASLTDADLELIGFSHAKEREELLTLFAELPNQDPTYDNICALPEATNYNREILHSATQHLENMRSALAAANYKLKIMPPEDIVVGEKHFASRFVLDALTELKNATNEINKELANLEELIAGEQNENIKKAKLNAKMNGCANRSLWIVWCTMTTFGALAALWFLKENNRLA